jgi:hypothetical protein
LAVSQPPKSSVDDLGGTQAFGFSAFRRPMRETFLRWWSTIYKRDGLDGPDNGELIEHGRDEFVDGLDGSLSPDLS